MKRNDRKYIRLVHFIKALKADLVISKYLYDKNGYRQYKNEYRYNKYLLNFIKNKLEESKELNAFLKCLNQNENSGISIDNIKINKSTRTVYRMLNLQYNKLANEIYNMEDALYEKYINKKEIR